MKSSASRVIGLAAAQWGLLTTAQAEAVGVSRSSLARLCAQGDLERVGHGVYVLAGADDALTTLRAAWLSLAPSETPEERWASLPGDAVVSHASASALHDLGDLAHDVAEFTVPEPRRTVRAGIRLHQARLAAQDVTIVEGLPVTSIERTIADLLSDRKQSDPEHIARIIGDALVAAHLDVDHLAELLEPLAHRYRQLNGTAFAAWLVELSGNGPAALAEKLGRVAFGRHVIDLALQNAFTDDTNSALHQLIARLADWVATNPGVERDLQAASRAALADPDIAKAVDVIRSLPSEGRREIAEIHSEASIPALEYGLREATRLETKVDPTVVQVVTAAGELND